MGKNEKEKGKLLEIVLPFWGEAFGFENWTFKR